MTLATVAIAVTLIIYVPAFFISANAIPASTALASACSIGGLDFLEDIVHCIATGLGFFGGLIFLTGLPDIDPVFKTLCVFAMFLLWGLVILGQVRGSAQG